MSVTSANDAVRTHYCKVPGCTNEARSPVGAYSYCDLHRGQRAEASRSPQSDASMATEIAALARDAKRVDRIQAKAEKLATAAATAKATADAARAQLARRLAAIGAGS